MPSDHFDTVSFQMNDDLNERGRLEKMQGHDGRLLFALDGTKYFHSNKRNCPYCSSTIHANGTIDCQHSFIRASIEAPGCSTVLPLAPEFVCPQGGGEKQDCERMAAYRWFSRQPPRFGALRPV